MTASYSSQKTPDVIEADGETFTVLEVLGKGGMGIVYKAHSGRLDRLVALKMLHESLFADPVALQRLQREAQAAAGLTHPNIVQVYRLANCAQTPLLVMEFVNGKTLADLIEAENKIPADKVIDWFVQALDALQAIHDKGFVHRDIKPSNIIVTADGVIKISDFGIAKPYLDSDAQRMTQTGMMIGSPAYMSPEQCGGQSVDPRSDLYSLACTMYNALSGHAPFDADSALELMLKQMNDQAETLQDLAISGLAEVVAKAMEKSPDARYQSAVDFKQALLNPAAEASVRTSRKGKRKPQQLAFAPRAVATATVAAASLCVACFVMFQIQQQQQPQQTASNALTTIEQHALNKEERQSFRQRIGTLPPAERTAKAQQMVQALDKAIAEAKGSKRHAVVIDLIVDKATLIELIEPDAAGAVFAEAVTYGDQFASEMNLDRDWEARIFGRDSYIDYLGRHKQVAAYMKVADELSSVIALRRESAAPIYHKTMADLDIHISSLSRNVGDFNTAERYARNAVAEEIAAQREACPEYFFAIAELSVVLASQIKTKELLQLAEKELPKSIAEAKSNPSERKAWLASYIIAENAAGAAALLHQRRRCEEYFEIAIPAGIEAGVDSFSLANTRIRQASNYSIMGDNRNCFRMAQLARQDCNGDPVGKGLPSPGCLTYITSAMNAGDAEAAYEVGTKLLKKRAKEMDIVGKFAAYLTTADACLQLRKLDESSEYLRVARSLRNSVERFPEWLIQLESVEARLRLAQGDFEGARQHFRAGEKIYPAARTQNLGMASSFRDAYTKFKMTHGA